MATLANRRQVLWITIFFIVIDMMNRKDDIFLFCATHSTGIVVSFSNRYSQRRSPINAIGQVRYSSPPIRISFTNRTRFWFSFLPLTHFSFRLGTFWLMEVGRIFNLPMLSPIVKMPFRSLVSSETFNNLSQNIFRNTMSVPESQFTSVPSYPSWHFYLV